MSSPPTTLGKYQIIREIARSNDIVYEAYDPLMNRRVALKELSMPNGSTPQQKEERINRFKREARAAGTLAHPNIMTVYELGEEGDRYFIAMEFLDGCTLRNEIDTKGSLGTDRAIEIANEVLKGLEFAHTKGVIHRDIKPDNIQILSDGRIKLTDFGIARLTFEPNLTMDGQVFGTPSYMSPEQVVGREIDARSDLFSVGIVLYEMIGGHKPFAGDSVVSITYAIMNKEPERLNEANFALWQVIERALDKSPALRYSSANEMMGALEKAQAAASAGPVLDLPPVINANPAGSYGATGNPYLTPMPNQYGSAAPAPPPVLYPYNPYTSNAPSAAPYASNSATLNAPYVPNPAGLPIYYPPPPRGPMMKPETRQFLGKMMLALVIGGTIITVLFVLINAFASSVQRSELERTDKDSAVAFNDYLHSLPVDQQIPKVMNFKRTLRSDVVREQEDRFAASLYETQGRQYFAKRQYAEAENSYVQARDLDPNNGAYYSDLGEVYSQVASEFQDAQQREELWRESAQSWMNATHVEQDPNRKTRFADGAAKATYNLAATLAEAGEVTEARDQLLEARAVAPKDSAVVGRIDQLLAELNTGVAGR